MLGRLFRMKDIRVMCYQDDYKQFWNCVYWLCGGTTLRLFSGPMGTGRNEFNPFATKINFAVPSVTTLNNIHSEVSRIVHPGILESILEDLAVKYPHNVKEFVLAFDGKGLSQGLKGESLGDINLWGHQERNLMENSEKFIVDNALFNDMCDGVKNRNFCTISEKGKSILKTVTNRIKELRGIIADCDRTECKFSNLATNNPDNVNRYLYVINAATYLSDNCQTAKKRCLYFNREMCHLLGLLCGTKQFICQENICNLTEQSNVWLLQKTLDIQDLQKYDNKNLFTRKGSEEHLLKYTQARVNSTNMFDALGLSSLNNQGQHYSNKFSMENIYSGTKFESTPGALTDYQWKVR